MLELITARWALVGKSGVGKSTIAAEVRVRTRSTYTLALAEPLYDLQREVHDRVDRPTDADKQDGALLNFLGSHTRHLNPDILLKDLSDRIRVCERLGADRIICADARPRDIPALREQGFVIIEVRCPDDIRLARRDNREDLSALSDAHPTETVGADEVAADLVFDNSGPRSALLEQIDAIFGVQELRKDDDMEQATMRHLVANAAVAIDRVYVENRHQIGCVLLDSLGRRWTGIHLETIIGPASVCAERAALASAIHRHGASIVMAASVRHPKPGEHDQRYRVVPPCGLCREAFADHAPDAQIVLDINGVLQSAAVATLLPHKYRGTKW